MPRALVTQMPRSEWNEGRRIGAVSWVIHIHASHSHRSSTRHLVNCGIPANEPEVRPMRVGRAAIIRCISGYTTTSQRLRRLSALRLECRSKGSGVKDGGTVLLSSAVLGARWDERVVCPDECRPVAWRWACDSGGGRLRHGSCPVGAVMLIHARLVYRHHRLRNKAG